MKVATCLLVASLGILACMSVQAAVYYGTGTVYVLDALDLTQFGANTTWFELSGVSSLGSCAGWGQGAILRLKDDSRGQQMYAMLEGAYMSQTSVTVYVDDTYKDSSGYCYAEQLILGTMP